MRTDNINPTMERHKVTRSWFNTFAQNCYRLEDGTTIYIDYDQQHVIIEHANKEANV